MGCTSSDSAVEGSSSNKNREDNVTQTSDEPKKTGETTTEKEAPETNEAPQSQEAPETEEAPTSNEPIEVQTTEEVEVPQQGQPDVDVENEAPPEDPKPEEVQEPEEPEPEPEPDQNESPQVDEAPEQEQDLAEPEEKREEHISKKKRRESTSQGVTINFDTSSILNAPQYTQGYAVTKIYLVIIGQPYENNPDNAHYWWSPDGGWKAMSEDDNTHSVQGYTGEYAQYWFEYIDETIINWTETIQGGRVYIGYNDPIWMQAAADGGYAPPSVSNPNVPGYKTMWDIIEFTYDTKLTLIADTSQIDSFSIPMTIQLSQNDGENVTLVNGIADNKRKKIMKKFAESNEDIWNQLVVSDDSDSISIPLRIISPNQLYTLVADVLQDKADHKQIKAKKAIASYFDEYVETVWNNTSGQEPFTVYVDGNVTGTFENGVLNFNNGFSMEKPSSMDLWKQKGTGLATGNIGPNIAASVCRGTIDSYASKWDDPTKFFIMPNDSKNLFYYVFHSNYNTSFPDVPQAGRGYTMPFDDNSYYHDNQYEDTLTSPTLSSPVPGQPVTLNVKLTTFAQQSDNS